MFEVEMIDPHLHIQTVSCEELYLMATAGITAVVTQSAYPCNNIGTNPQLWLEPITSKTIISHWEQLIKFETWRTRLELIDSYVSISLNAFSVPPDYEKVLEALPQYLKEDKVVALGETCLDPTSKTCPDVGRQEEILRTQLRMAKKYNKAICIHTPFTEKEKWVRRLFDIISEEDIDRSKVVIEHADATVAKIISEFGCNAGISVQPSRNMTPADAARIAAACQRDRVTINSDCSSVYSDPLSVPKTALEMRRLGLNRDEVKEIIFDNPCRIFGIWK